MGISSDIPGTPFQALPPAPGMASSGITQNPNIRGMANAAKQNVTNKQQRFMRMVEGSGVQSANNNTATTVQQMPQMMKQQAVPSEDYIKAGMLLVERREEIDKFIDQTLFG